MHAIQWNVVARSSLFQDYHEGLIRSALWRHFVEPAFLPPSSGYIAFRIGGISSWDLVKGLSAVLPIGSRFRIRDDVGNSQMWHIVPRV